MKFKTHSFAFPLLNPYSPTGRRMYVLEADDGNGGASGQGSTGDQNSQGDDVDFTPAQQAKLQKLFNESFAKGATKAEKEAAKRIQELETELTKLKKPDDKKPDAKPGHDEETIKKLLEGVRGEYEPQLKAATEQIEKLKSHQRTATIVSAAAKAKAVDPEVVATLVGASVGFDDEGRIVVLDPNGQPRLNRKGDPMDVEEYVKAFLDERPYLKQASNQGGAGSGTNGAGSLGNQKAKNWGEAKQMLGQMLQSGALDRKS